MLVESGHDDDGSENDSTPLAHMNDLKTSSLVDSPEQNSSWFDKLTFLWLTNLLRRGAAKPINSSDLYNLKPSDVPVHNWRRYQKYRKQGRSLIVTLGLTYAPELLTQFALTMALCVSRFASPFFLQRILRSIEFTQQQGLIIEAPRNRYADVAGLLSFAVLSLVVYNQSLWIGRQIGIRLKGFLVAELTTKTLCRRGKGSSSSGSKGLQDDLAASDGKVMNILTTDFNTVIAVGSYLDNIYNLPVMLVIGIWYMYKMLGVSALIGLVITILYIPLSKILFSRYQDVIMQQSAASDRRISSITEVLQGIKVIKLFGWETQFLKKVDDRREKQLAHSWKAFLWMTSISASSTLNPIIVLVIMFAFYVGVFGNTLDAETAFTSIAVFQMVRTAISHLPGFINFGVGGYVALKRIDLYLQQPQAQDLEKRCRQVQTTSNVLGFEKSEDEYNKEHLQKLAIKKGINPDIDLSMLQGVLIKEEEREEGYVKLNVWKTFMQACGGVTFWGYLALVLIVGETITALRSYWIKVWVATVKNPVSGLNVIDGVLSSSTSPDIFAFTSGYAGGIATSSHHSSVYWLGIYTLLGFISVVWSAIMWYSMFTGRLEMARKLHRQLMRVIVHAVHRFHESTPAGRIINRFSRDIAIIDNGALDSIVYWFSGIASVLAVYIIVSMAIPVFAVAAIITISIFVMIALYYLHTSRELKRLESNSMSPLLSLFGELIQGTTTIRAFNVKHYYIKEAINRISTHNRSFYGVWSTNMWLGMRVEAVSAVVASTTAIFILFNLDWIDAGMAGFILLYAMSFSDQMFWVIRDYSGNEMNMNAMERIMQYLNIDQEAALESEPENKPSAVWPKKGDLQIKDLVVDYLPGMPVLHGISLSIKHGERIGIVGRTGAGKSTILLALLRFLEASKGKIVLDGVDISRIGLEDLRRNVTVIPQDPVLFNGTIRFNLDPFNEHPDELLWEALRRTHLARDNASQASGADGSDDFLTSERMAGIFASLDAEIRENGHNISAGQRQLVALARAMIRRSRLIIMDEATASVDFDTDKRIQNTIRGPEFANSTLLCIAHRLRTIIDYDKVLVLDDGRVAEFDTPHNLLQSKDGIFRSMCEESGEYKAYVRRKGL
ncbi:hypothetical protein H4217_001050 [Coemansia sp. RSA 1939]|nr:hypothetical protein H4217_001050 [Coemansia sp. RSA 1939]